VTLEAVQARPAVFRQEVRDAVRYERGLVLAVVAVIVILRTLYFALQARTVRG